MAQMLWFGTEPSPAGLNVFQRLGFKPTIRVVFKFAAVVHVSAADYSDDRPTKLD